MISYVPSAEIQERIVEETAWWAERFIKALKSEGTAELFWRRYPRGRPQFGA
jgi:hypothetical protein